MNRGCASCDECLETRYFAVNWFKRYVVGCLIAALFFAAVDSSKAG